MESSSSLPIVDLSPLKNTKSLNADVAEISRKLGNAFETTGFAYLTNAPLNLDHGDIFGIAKELFSMSEEQKMKLAKKMFRKQNGNTYRGYAEFPCQITLFGQFYPIFLPYGACAFLLHGSITFSY